MTQTINSVQDARALQDAHKGRWSAIVREAIIDTLRGHSTFHADDLEPLGIPDEHRNCIGSQTAKLVNQHWIEEVGRRKSKLPSRNGAKSGEYQLTPLGRMKLVGFDASPVDAPSPLPGSSTPPTCVESGESGVGGRGRSRSDSAGAEATSGPVGRLFEPEPERPLSAFRDAEAA